jgi:hypothetical protein
LILQQDRQTHQAAEVLLVASLWLPLKEEPALSLLETTSSDLEQSRIPLH